MGAITHTFVSAVTDGTDPDVVKPSDWNDEHDITVPLTIGNIIIDTGSITCSGGTITLDDDNLTTSGKITGGEVQITGDLNHDGTKVGFFGTAPVVCATVADAAAIGSITGSDTVSASAVATELAALRTKLNALLDALQGYGLIAAS